MKLTFKLGFRIVALIWVCVLASLLVFNYLGEQKQARAKAAAADSSTTVTAGDLYVYNGWAELPNGNFLVADTAQFIPRRHTVDADSVYRKLEQLQEQVHQLQEQLSRNE